MSASRWTGAVCGPRALRFSECQPYLVRLARQRCPCFGRIGGTVHQRHFATTCALVTAIAAVSLQGVTLAGQTAARSTPKAEKAWTPPRGPDGHADLSGVW